MINSTALQIYRSAFAKMEDFIYLLDKDGFLIDCNKNLLRFLGFSKPIGSIYDMMQKQSLWTSEQIRYFQQHDIDAIMSGTAQKEQQALIKNDGSIHYFVFSRVPLADEQGNALGLLVVLSDQTKQKQLNERLKHIKAKMRYSNQFSSNTLSSENTSESSNKFKILLIEDNAIAQKAEKTVLMSCRCMTDIVASPRQANEIFKPGKYDLVLMDLTLEEGDGYHLTAILRQREKGSNFRVPIIALTGHDPTLVGYNCEDAEMDGIMRKPLTVEQAQQLIQRYIRHAEVDVKGLKEFKQ